MSAPHSADASSTGAAARAGEPLLQVRDLRVTFATDAGRVQAVDGVTFDVRRGETLAIVGESGSGKSVTALSLLRLLDGVPGATRSGQALLEGRDLLALGADAMRAVRGNRIAMIFQEPMTSLNPVFSVGDQIAEAIMLHRRLPPEQARVEVVELLRLVGIPAPERRADEYPHQMSGGMRQRVMIAMALSCRPRLLIADEPTTALDVTVQAQILDLLSRLQAELGMSVLMITHDLGVVAEVAHRAIVMYAGKVVEEASVTTLFEAPKHPYTAGLLESLPSRSESGAYDRNVRLRSIEGSVPDALNFPPGCRFHPRCRYRFEPCARDLPELAPVGRVREADSEHRAACWYTEAHPEASLITGDAPARAGAPP
jgi:oligopeptide/dipeptide ABC transporter ATP-binding protein